MRGSTAYNWQEKFLRRVQDVYSNGVHFHLTHDEILIQLKQKVYDLPAWSQVPEYVRAFIAGWIKCKADSIYGRHLIWMLSIDGELLTSKEAHALGDKERDKGFHTRPDYKSPYQRCNTELSRHVWLDKDGSTALRDKPY